MAIYLVTVEASVLVEANSASEAFGILDSALDSDLYNTLESIGEDVEVTIREPEEQ